VRIRGGLRHALSVMATAVVLAAIVGAVAAPAGAASIWTIQATPNRGNDFNELTGVAAVSATDVWAAGLFRNPSTSQYRTLIEHFDGTAWRVVPSPNVGPSYNELNAVAADSSTDAWVVGFSASGSTNRTLAERWNGATWSVVPTPNGAGSNTLRGVTALSPTDAWAVGDQRSPNPATLALHWDGASWTVVPTPTPLGGASLAAVAAVSSNDVWAVGSLGDGDDGALVEHWNGSSWSIVSTPEIHTISLLAGVTAIASSDVWAVGSQGSRTLTEHWDGTRWTVVTSPNPLPTTKGNNFLTAVTAVSSSDVWAVGSTLDFTLGGLERTMTLNWDGNGWQVVNTPDRGPGSNLLIGADSPGGGVVFTVGTVTAPTFVNRTLALETTAG